MRHVDAGVSADAGGRSDASLAADAAVGPIERRTQVTDHGVTWTFAQAVPVGRFITGEYYVVGAVTVTAIDPPPAPGRNGSIVNLRAVQDESPWDDRVEAARYDASARVVPPITLAPGDSLLSSISVAQTGAVENWLREGNGEASNSPVRSISVLTCLAQPVSADAFRPAYTGGAARIHRLADVRRSLLPSLAPPQPIDTGYLQMFAERSLRPWVDNLTYAFDAQLDYMPMYGREMGRAAGIMSLLLMLELPAAQAELQQRLLVGFVQHGLDLWGLVEAGYPGWYAHGGHGSGRKWFIVLAGMLLGDPRMSSPNTSYPNAQFGEDMHTAYASAVPSGGPNWWNGAPVVYTGHMGLWQGRVVSDTAGWGPYEHLTPDQWQGDAVGESYRRCCTSIAWIGQALAARLVNAQGHWRHDAFFDYADRWMDGSDDSAYTQAIFERSGHDFRAAWAAQGQTWDALVNQMWARYR